MKTGVIELTEVEIDWTVGQLEDVMPIKSGGFLITNEDHPDLTPDDREVVHFYNKIVRLQRKVKASG